MVDQNNNLDDQWYIVHTYSGQEERVKRNLDIRISTMDISDRILEVLVPTQDEVEIKDGQRKRIARTVFPGYVLVKMMMDDECWHVVRNTPGVTGFVSAEDETAMRSRPVPLTPSEVEKILDYNNSDEQPKITIAYSVGQTVRITEGPFLDFMGMVEEVYSDRSKVKVLVSFFGRETPVELDFVQIERI
jgi:transcriptional antiterminator NusG